ncbi:MAG: LuxR C-terminal-related transcriptional regulator [Acidimicrobiia bacterium]|nr:LuxR C-terminal-related transcriptional regulator [Acidimicrobiia bacterium]
MAVRLNRAGHRPFVGRARELAAAADILAAAERTGVVLLGGESGLGKTRLAEEIIAAAPPGSRVIRGGAVPRATPIPFELVRSALDPIYARLEAEAAADPEGSQTAPDSEADTVVARIRAEAEALRTAGHGPTIYLFEDVHWADPESLEVIDRLMVAGPLGATILITYRPNALHPGHPTSTFLQRAERRPQVVQFRLEPLRREEVKAYLAATGRPVDPKTVEHVHTRTGGNPLLLSELEAAFEDDADLTAGLPWTLAEMLRPEIERLPPEERAVAEAVAVLGTEVDFELLAAAVDATEDRLLERLRALVDRAILIESGPDRFGFRHDMVREAVADSLFTREHRRIHAAVHDALLAAGSDDVVALVAHATGAGRVKQAADAARDAAARALVEGRTHQALAFAEQALLEHTDDIELLRIAVVSGWLSGQDRTALHHLDRWEELVGTTGSDKAEVLHHRVRLLWEEGDGVAADRAAVELAALTETLDDGPTLAQALADLAQHNMLNGREKEAVELADRAIAVAATVGPAADRAALQARVERASALVCWTGPTRDETIENLLAVATEAEAAGDHLVASRALNNTPIQHPSIDARAHVEWMRRTGERAGMRCIATETYRRSLLVVSLMDGDREAFASQLEAALEDLGHVPQLELLAASVALHERRFDDARRSADRLSGLGTSSHFSASWPEGLSTLADLLEFGRSAPFSHWLSRVGTRFLEVHFALELVVDHLEALLQAGLRIEVGDILDRLGDGISEPAHLGIRAELAGRWDEAGRRYAEALELGTYRTVFNQVELHLALARVAAASGADGRPHLDAALDRLCCWPGPRRDGLAARLGTDGGQNGPPTALTPREREVAALVARGLTNGGIADELYISTKTASVHVSNILAKLNMTSRTEIASWVTGGGLG